MTKTQLLRPLAAAGTSLVLAIGGVAVTAGPAAADTPGCVTKKEYRKVHKGMTRERVHRIFDTRGWFAGGGAGGFEHGYRGCLPRGHVAYIAYVIHRHGPARLHSKRWINDD